MSTPPPSPTPDPSPPLPTPTPAPAPPRKRKRRPYLYSVRFLDSQGEFYQWEGVTNVAEVATFHEELGSYSKHQLQYMVHERDAAGRWACKRRVRKPANLHIRRLAGADLEGWAY